VVAVRPRILARAGVNERLRDLGLLAGLVLWLAYTYAFWTLRASHLVLPPCAFYTITGHPCPFCGGTRSFAYMWQGDLVDAARMYPLGPVLFGGSLAAVAGLAGGLLSGRTLNLNLASLLHGRLLKAGLALLAISWALKVFWLGN